MSYSHTSSLYFCGLSYTYLILNLLFVLLFFRKGNPLKVPPDVTFGIVLPSDRIGRVAVDVFFALLHIWLCVERVQWEKRKLRTQWTQITWFFHRCWRYTPLHGHRHVHERAGSTAKSGQLSARTPQEGQLPELPIPAAGIQALWQGRAGLPTPDSRTHSHIVAVLCLQLVFIKLKEHCSV